uniref:MI domain-containing protein n=1 Tax=Hyaloperonospora arabidopsidis (strain Emoy2) TaxID=559515 RepID=M4BLV4_HYAAE
MDERPRAGAGRRGRGRSGGYGRKPSSSGVAYRRVQVSVDESVRDAGSTSSSGVACRRVQVSVDESVRDAGSTSSTDKSSCRSVQKVDDSATKEVEGPPLASFKSSLRPSVEVRSAPAIEPERFVRVKSHGSVPNRECSSERPKSLTPKKNDLQVPMKGRAQSTLRPTSSPQNEARPFVSSLVQSMDHGRDRGARTKRGERRGRDIQGPSLRRSISREPRQGVGNENGSYRGETFGSDKRSVSRPQLSRKSSVDSVSSVRSDRSDVSHRSERYNEVNRSSNDGPQRNRRLSGGLSGKAPFRTTPVGMSSATYGVRDVRYQKERPTSEYLSGRLAPDKPSGRSSLDGSASPLRRVISGALEGLLNDRDDSSSGRSSTLQPSPSAPQNADVKESISPKPKESFGATKIKDTSAIKPATPVVGEAERKHLVDTLRERMESRKLERGDSLAQMMKAPLSCKGLTENEAQRSPVGAKKDVGNGGSPIVVDESKDARTREYYAKLDKENVEREALRRATSFKSSLSSSGSTKAQLLPTLYTEASPRRRLSSYPSAPVQTGSVRPPTPSLVAGRALVQPTVSRTKKLQYSLAELRSIRKSDRPDVRSGVRGAKPAVSVRDGRRDRQIRGGRGGSRGGRTGGGRGNYGRPPPPPLYDGPIEPLTVSENRWKPTKEKDVSGLEKTLNDIKSLLNKLTREKFTKLTNKLCAIDIDSFVLLSSIVSIIMDKALEEPGFADVYSDLCKEFHTRTIKTTWSFLKVLSDDKGAFYWTAIDKTTFKSFVGPFDSPHSCLESIGVGGSAATVTCDCASILSMQYHYYGEYLVVVGEKEPGAFYFSAREVSGIKDDEPFGGPFETVDLARHAAASQTSFRRLLVNRCQVEFEKTNKHVGSQQEKQEKEEIDPRRREVLAMRAKAKMLGNIRFIGELYKVDLIKQKGVEGCIFYLLGLELLPGVEAQEGQAQAVRFPDEVDLEALCKILATAGKKFDQPDTKTIMQIIILRMVELSNDTKLPSRARFLVKDILETRDHMWEPRRKEMQQKTLEEVRREAQKLQQQGKNAQHDDVQRRRLKTRVSSAQLAKQSSNLIVAKQQKPDKAEASEADKAKELSPAQMSTRIKSIIEEYISILDVDEAITCVQELPRDPYHVAFAEQTVYMALEGKTSEREHAADLLVTLYERTVVDANSIQSALVNAMEFLEDMKIDLPLIHQYSALIFGRLVAAGCFGLSWIISGALAHCVECKLASQVFPDVLSVLEMESDEGTVIRMLTDEEVTPESVLPAAMRTNEADVKAYLRESGMDIFFGGDSDAESELGPEIAGKMRRTLEEYLSVKDFDEMVQCVEEFDAITDRWRHFVHIMLVFSLEAKQSARKDVAELLVQLFDGEKVASDDIETGVESILDDYDDLLVDIPRLAVNLSELYQPLFLKKALSVRWLGEACSRLVESGHAADVLDALLSAFDDPDALVAWWKTQSDVDAIWTQLSPLDERLVKWKARLQ